MAKELEKAAKVKPINGRLPSGHAHAGGQMPLPKHLHAKYGTHLPFTDDGFPDFRKFSRKKVKITMRGDRRLDEQSANIAADFKDGTPKHWTWHHQKAPMKTGEE